MKALVLAVALFAGSAQAQQSDEAAWAVGADAATTAIGLTMPGVAEYNPLGYWSVAIRLGVLQYAKTLPKESAVPIVHQVNAMGWGAAANNLLVLAGAGAIGPAVGLTLGLVLWSRGSEEREFWDICAMYKRDDPNIKTCTYKGTTA